MKDFETRECVVHTHTQLTQIREGTTKCLFSFFIFKKIGGDKHLG